MFSVNVIVYLDCENAQSNEFRECNAVIYFIAAIVEKSENIRKDRKIGRASMRVCAQTKHVHSDADVWYRGDLASLPVLYIIYLYTQNYNLYFMIEKNI